MTAIVTKINLAGLLYTYKADQMTNHLFKSFLHHSPFLFYFLCGQILLLQGQTTVNPQLKHQLDSVFKLDQGIRILLSEPDQSKRHSIAEAYGFPKFTDNRSYFQLLNQIDSSNWVFMEKVLQKHGYPGKSLVGEPSNEAAFFVIQHNIDQIETYLGMVQEAGRAGELRQTLVAMMEDRYLVDLEKEQLYGTQGATYEMGQSFIWPIRDPQYVNQRRKKLGFELTVEENAKRLFGEDFEYKEISLEEALKRKRAAGQ